MVTNETRKLYVCSKRFAFQFLTDPVCHLARSDYHILKQVTIKSDDFTDWTYFSITREHDFFLPQLQLLLKLRDTWLKRNIMPWNHKEGPGLIVSKTVVHVNSTSSQSPGADLHGTIFADSTTAAISKEIIPTTSLRQTHTTRKL